MFVRKDANIDSAKCHIVPNGYDPADFKDLTKSENATFTICYTGTMADTYEPDIFINALAKLKETNPESNIKLQMIGYISDNIKSLISNKIPGLELIPSVPHNEIVKYQKNADLLLLVIPDIKHAEGILTGKIFEYLASGNPIIGIGPENGDAAKIIDQCGAGKFFDRTKQKEIIDYLENCMNDFYTKKPFKSNRTEVNKFSRKEQSQQIKHILNELNKIAL